MSAHWFFGGDEDDLPRQPERWTWREKGKRLVSRLYVHGWMPWRVYAAVFCWLEDGR